MILNLLFVTRYFNYLIFEFQFFVIVESLRMYPTPFTVRKAKSAYTIPGTDIVLDKGTRLVIPIHAIHHDPVYYPNPEQFDPDRFEDKVKNDRNSMAWLAFGSGPRIWFVNKTFYR